MADRSVTLTLRAQIDGFKRAMREAEESARKVGKGAEDSAKLADTAAGRMVQSATKNQEAWDRAGATLMGFGTAAVGGLALAAKAAIDWESAFAGVRKTVDGSDAQIAALEGELRQLARTLPSTHAEIAATAEAAGQLGVARDDIADFTRTMIDLGETTNLTAEEAATSIAQMMNVMQTAPQDVDRLGATLVALGNDGASTEKQIIEMSQRIAGAAAVVGLAEGEVLALANTVASMGIDVEAGGSSVSRVLTDMGKAAQTGSDELEIFAQTAGMSAEEFATAFREDPAEAFALFIEGLGRVQEAGGNVFGILDDLALSDVRVSQALLGMASSGDLLRESLELQETAWSENTALVEEAAKRYDTTAAKAEIARNSLVDMGISAGEVLLPVLADTAEKAAELAQWFADLPQPVQEVGVAFGGAAGAAGLAGGAFLLLFPRVLETVQAFRDLQSISPGASRGLAAVGKAAGIATALVALTSGLAAVGSESGAAVSGIEDTTAALLRLRNSGGTEAVDELFAGFDRAMKGAVLPKIVPQVNDLRSAVERLGDPSLANRVEDTLDWMPGVTTDAEKAAEQMTAIGESLAFLVDSGNGEMAAEIFEQLYAGVDQSKTSVEEFRDLLGPYADAVQRAANEQGLASESGGQLAAATNAVGQTAEQAEKALSDFSDALDRLLGATFSVSEAQDVWQQGLNDLNDLVEQNGAALSGTTDEAIANREAMRSQITSGADLIRTMAEQGATTDELKAKAAQLKEEFIRNATAAGFNADEVAALAGTFDEIPRRVDSTIAVNNAQAMRALQDTLNALQRLDGRQVVTTVVTQNVQTGRTNARSFRMEADGGVLDFFADGGFKEDHVAQIAPAGAWRVWAEPETGGEAYIPLAASKRDRSVAIWQETGRRLGQFADGGFWGGPSEGGTAEPVVLGGVTYSGTVYAFDPEAHARATVRKQRDIAAVAGLHRLGRR